MYHDFICTCVIVFSAYDAHWFFLVTEVIEVGCHVTCVSAVKDGVFRAITLNFRQVGWSFTNAKYSKQSCVMVVLYCKDCSGLIVAWCCKYIALGLA